MTHGTNSYSFSVASTEEPIATYALFFLGVGWGVQVKVKTIWRNCHCYSQKCKNCAINVISYILHQPDECSINAEVKSFFT